MASPLEAATSFVALASLSKVYGWEFFAELRKYGLVAEGSNASVLTRIETGERPLGLLPLESVLRAGGRNQSLKIIYPADGVIPVPGSIAIMKETEHPEIAKSVYDWFFSPAAQTIFTRAGSYSPLPKFPPPEGAHPWAEVAAQMMPWSPEIASEMLLKRDRTRAKFSEIVLH
jgi:ABC-type Fe3+ transport system substrate-binding protein